MLFSPIPFFSRRFPLWAVQGGAPTPNDVLFSVTLPFAPDPEHPAFSWTCVPLLNSGSPSFFQMIVAGTQSLFFAFLLAPVFFLALNQMDVFPMILVSSPKVFFFALHEMPHKRSPPPRNLLWSSKRLLISLTQAPDSSLFAFLSVFLPSVPHPMNCGDSTSPFYCTQKFNKASCRLFWTPNGLDAGTFPSFFFGVYEFIPSRICAWAAIRSRNPALSSYSLSDGLSQHSVQ